MVWCSFKWIQYAFKWIQYELIWTGVHTCAHPCTCFISFSHWLDISPYHYTSRIQILSNPISTIWSANHAHIYGVFIFLQKWSIMVILSNGTWRSFENEKNVDFHHILTHWKLWYFSWDLRWLKFRTRTFKKCKWFVFKFINYYFIIVNCQVVMRKGHKNADMERYAPIWSDVVWYAHLLLQYQ